MRLDSSHLREWRWPLLVLVPGLVLAAAAGWAQHRANQRHVHERLQAAAERVADQLRRRLQSYEFGLIADRSAVLAAGAADVELQRRSFQRFAGTLPLQNHFPGARGLGFIRRLPRAQEEAFVAAERRAGAADFSLKDVTPALDRPALPRLAERFVVHFITPRKGNEGAQGLDVATGEHRREALLAAMRSGEARISAPLTLRQAQDARERGLLLFLPIYAQGRAPDTVAGREADALGWAHMPLVMDEVLGDFDFGREGLSLVVADATEPGEPQRFFTAPHWRDAAAAPPTHRLELPVFGRRWRVDVQALPAFVTQLHQPHPGLVALGVAALAALSALLLHFVARTYREHAALAALVEGAHDAIIGHDAQGRVTGWNPAAERMLGWPAHEALGRDLFSLLTPVASSQAALQRVRARLFAGQGVPPFDAEALDATGAAVPVSASLTPLRDRAGRVAAAAATLRDMRPQRAAQARVLALNATLEQQVRQRTQELERLAVQLRERTHQAETANAAKTTFLANMSHEIRTPLNAVIGLSQLLEQTPLDERQHRFVHHINLAGEQLLGLVNDILDLSKIEAGEMHLEHEPFELPALLGQLRALTEEAALSKQLQWQLDVAHGVPPRLRGDAVRIKQVLTNLLSNAVKFTQAGAVTLRVRTLAGAQPPAAAGAAVPHANGDTGPPRVLLGFEVVDTGIGIPAEKQVAIFQPFTQADASTTRRFGGTGLGLSIVQRLVMLMGGRLALQSEPGRGSTFSVELPLEAEAAPPAPVA
jgi:PAS domain S-box-containing protein